MNQIWAKYKMIIIIALVIIGIIIIYLIAKPSATENSGGSGGTGGAGSNPGGPTKSTNILSTILTDVGGWFGNLFTKKPTPITNSPTGCSSITGSPVIFGCGCPSPTGSDNNGNACPPDCINGCKQGTTGVGCDGNASPYC